MAVATAVHGGRFPSPSKSLCSPSQLKITGQIKQSPPSPQIYISTNPSHVNLHHLKNLSNLCNHSFHRFPNVDPTGKVEAADVNKLRIAIMHSYVVVSVFTRPELVTKSSSPVEESNSMGIGGDWTRRVMPVTPDNGQLIGFGRAVSDSRLTASIYDIMVHPALQGSGIGRRIVKKIVRILIDRGIYDIGALCSDEERLPGMGKIWVEICLISGRGLQRTSSLWKLQWFAVGWIDPNNQYCTKIDASGNNNPVWKTKFSVAVDTSEPIFQDLALHVEVYSREPIFLRESLLGTATIVLKEFMDKYTSSSEVPKPVEEVGSFQLRKKNSNKPKGFVDISICISEERKDPGSSSLGGQEDYKLMDQSGVIKLVSRYGQLGNFRPQLPQTQPQQLASHPLTNSQYAHPMPVPTNYSQPPNYPPADGPSYRPVGGPSYQPPQTPPPPLGYQPVGGPSYQPPRTPPPRPPPPSNVGYIPSFLPRTNNEPPSYVNMPSSAGPPGTIRGGGGPGFGMGVGAGALAAGAMIFGDDFMSGFDFPSGLQDASLTISANPPF